MKDERDLDIKVETTSRRDFLKQGITIASMVLIGDLKLKDESRTFKIKTRPFVVEAIYDKHNLAG